MGIYSFGIAFAFLFRLVPNFGLVPVVARDIAQDPSREARLIPNVLYLRTALGLAGFVVLLIAVRSLGFDHESQEAAAIVGTLLFLLGLDTFQIVLQVRLRAALRSVADVAKAALTVVGALALVRSSAGVEAFLWLYVASNFLFGVVLMIAGLRLATFDWLPRLALWKPVILAAAPIAVSALFVILYSRLGIPVLAATQPIEDVGQYGAATRFLDTALLIPPLFMIVLTPVFARSATEGGGELGRRYRRVLRVIALVAAPMAIAGAMTAWRFVPGLPGFDEFGGAGVALSILASAAALIYLGTVVQGVLIATNNQGALVKISAVGLVVNVGLNAALIPQFSYVGAAIATVATELVVVGWSIGLVQHRLHLGWPGAELARVAGACLLMTVVLAVCLGLSVWIQLAAGLVAYGIAASLLKAFTPSDVLALLGRSGP